MNDQNELKNMGLKATFPRLKILDIFRRSDQDGQRHLSAEDVYRLLIAEEVDIGLATVYRVLTQFEQAGILVRSQFDGGKAVFELNDGDHHDHLVDLARRGAALDVLDERADVVRAGGQPIELVHAGDVGQGVDADAAPEPRDQPR